MKKYLQILSHTQLFKGLGEGEISGMLSCLDARSHTYHRGEYVFRQGEYVRDITLLVRGKLHIQRDDYWGNSNIISAVDVGEMFGEAYLAPNSGAILNNVVAVEDSTVLFFDARKVITTCSSACKYHAMVVQNLFFAISDKNRKLVQKLGHMSHRTTREKLMSYLSEESNRQNSATFVIPFNRQQLADFLSVDRSAMSHELCKMRDDGLILFEKSKFTLI
ncbi:MAG TPA: Crp/Fnr family transcriptional regulator [Candidatus Gallacutalibacter stercoravium]|nr:Crp/Fnr family transcriptional regulator [Candidatus Gallacutalibacter stercoravium]